MLSKNLSLRGNKITGRQYLICCVFNKRSVITIRYKADILAVRLMCNQKSDLIRHFPDPVFGIFSYRHQSTCQLFLGQIIQCIRLIFFHCSRTADRIPSIWKMFYPCIMACSNIISTDRKASLKQCLPFHIPVACNTGVWCSSGKIFFCKIFDHALLELILKIHDIIRNPDRSCNSSCVIHRTQSTAATVLFLHNIFFVLPDLHGHTYDIISLLF